MLQQHFYHKSIRKFVAAFGTMFNNITLVRYKKTDNTEVERLKVPLSYGPKEKYIYRLTEDTQFTRSVQIAMPRMSFELTNVYYDVTRKLNTLQQIYGPTKSLYGPVPYSFNFDLNLYTRNIEDGYQILEQILPYFTPDYTISVAMLSDPPITRDIPIILQTVDQNIEYEGDGGETTRIVVFSLHFLMQGFLYGSTTDSGPIRKIFVNMYSSTTPEDEFVLTMNTNPGAADYTDEEEVYYGDNYQDAVWRGRVLNWSNTQSTLVVYDVTKAFPAVGQRVHGIDSGAEYVIFASNREPLKAVQITIVPTPNNPSAASIANGTFVVDTTIEEFPDITTP